MRIRRIKRAALAIILITLGLIYCLPFYFKLINSFKPLGEILSSFLAFPSSPTLDNYRTAWEVINYPVIFLNTLIITVSTVILAVLLSSMTGYMLERTGNRFSRIIYLYFVFGMIIPFFVIMVPLMQLISGLGLMNNRLVLILYYVAGYVCFGTFMTYGFCRSIPREIEESARIDGANVYQIYMRIVMPLLTPATATLAIFFALWTWNDFIVAFLFMPMREFRTISPALFWFVGDLRVEWDSLTASLVLTTTPILVFYACAQKYIEKGLAAGAIKG